MTDQEFATVASTGLTDRAVGRWTAWLVAAGGAPGLAFFLANVVGGGVARVSYVAHLAGITVAELWYGLDNPTPTAY